MEGSISRVFALATLTLVAGCGPSSASDGEEGNEATGTSSPMFTTETSGESGTEDEGTDTEGETTGEEPDECMMITELPGAGQDLRGSTLDELLITTEAGLHWVDEGEIVETIADGCFGPLWTSPGLDQGWVGELYDSCPVGLLRLVDGALEPWPSEAPGVRTIAIEGDDPDSLWAALRHNSLTPDNGHVARWDGEQWTEFDLELELGLEDLNFVEVFVEGSHTYFYGSHFVAFEADEWTLIGGVEGLGGGFVEHLGGGLFFYYSQYIALGTVSEWSAFWQDGVIVEELGTLPDHDDLSTGALAFDLDPEGRIWAMQWLADHERLLYRTVDQGWVESAQALPVIEPGFDNPQIFALDDGLAILAERDEEQPVLLRSPYSCLVP